MNYSRQREAILTCLRNRYDHPSAEMVYESVRQEFQNVSLGTVYRNLTLLCETGDIVKVTSVDGHDRFDFNTLPHCHFVCRKCSSASDIPADMKKTVCMDELSDMPGNVERTVLLFYGICNSCLNRIRKESKI